MTERKTNDITDKQLFPEMSHGHTFLTDVEANFLKLRSMYRRHNNVSRTIQELIQPVIEGFENASPYERECQLRGYAEQVFRKYPIEVNNSQDNKHPTYIKAEWVLPKTLIHRLGQMATKVWCDPPSLMSCILANAIEMKNNT